MHSGCETFIEQCVSETTEYAAQRRIAENVGTRQPAVGESGKKCVKKQNYSFLLQVSSGGKLLDVC